MLTRADDFPLHQTPNPIAIAGTDRNLDASTMLVLGHVIVCVQEGEERLLFDPTFGSFFYRHDNKAFATERELGEDLSLADRFIRERHKDYFHPATHTVSPLGNVIWPPGAPEPVI